MSTIASTDERIAARPATMPRRPIGISVAAAAAGLAITASGGYGLGWRWTGFPGNRLWDWLHLLLLPVVLAGVPLWVGTHRSWRREWAVLFGALAAAFAVVAVGGYAAHWTWTGFAGNRLWDWLHLLVLPVAVALSPVWLTAMRPLGPAHRAGAAAAALVLAVVIAGGYGLGWSWTGFDGNTLWDWLNLLLVPVVVPVVFVWVAARLEEARTSAASVAPAE